MKKTVKICEFLDKKVLFGRKTGTQSFDKTPPENIPEGEQNL